MVYIKSLLAGIVAVLGAVVLSITAMSLYVYLTYKPKAGETVSWDASSLVSWHTWLFGVLIFIAGSVWQFRRARMSGA